MCVLMNAINFPQSKVAIIDKRGSPVFLRANRCDSLLSFNNPGSDIFLVNNMRWG